MKKIRKYLAVWMLLLAFLLAMPVQADAAVKISRKSITLLRGQSVTLEIIGADKKVKWSSKKEAVATVSGKGKVVARQAGTAIIKAKIGKKVRKYKVTVQAPYFKNSAVTLTEGQKTGLVLKGTNQKIKWSSSDKRIVSVDQEGRIAACAKGTAVIAATVLGKEFTCKVTVKEKAVSAGGSSAGGSGSSSGSSGGSISGGDSSGGSSGSEAEPSKVWVTASGTKYHRTSTCSNMKNPSLIPLSQAKGSGRGPCSKCF